MPRVHEGREGRKGVPTLAHAGQGSDDKGADVCLTLCDGSGASAEFEQGRAMMWKTYWRIEGRSTEAAVVE